jgi:hypothetical protein
VGQIFPTWWNKLPIVAAVADSLDATLAILKYPHGQIFDVITNGTGLREAP